MPANHSIFKAWVPKKWIIPVLVVAMFPHLMLLTMFSMNSTFTASFLDIDVDDLQFMFSMAYALIVCAMFLHGRLFSAMNVRTYLLVMTLLNIIVLLGMTCTTNRQAILTLRFIQGPLALFEGSIILPILMGQFKTPHAKFLGYSILYTYMLTSDKITTSIIKFAIEYYDHNTMVYVIILFHVAALFVYLLLFNHNRAFPKKPLYQLNLAGVLMMVISLISGAFFLIYGKRYDWFESELIIAALVSCLFFGILFVLHQLTSKRPLFHFGIFRSKRVVCGALLFVCFYLIRSGMSNIYQVMGTVWKWPWEYVLRVQYINVLGTILGVGSAYFLFTKQVSNRIVFAVGFFLLSVSMFGFSFLFYPDGSVETIGIPLFLEGFSQGFLFTPLVFFMVGAVNPSFSSHASQAGTAVRFWTTTGGFALMQNLLLYLTTKYEFLLTANLDVSSPVFQDNWNALFTNNISTKLVDQASRLSALSLNTSLSNQALLIANEEIFVALSCLGLAVVLLVILSKPLYRAWHSLSGRH